MTYQSKKVGYICHQKKSCLVCDDMIEAGEAMVITTEGIFLHYSCHKRFMNVTGLRDVPYRVNVKIHKIEEQIHEELMKSSHRRVNPDCQNTPEVDW